MTTKTIPANSSKGVYYGPGAANYTIVNNFTILNPNITADADSRYNVNGADIYEANNLTFRNNGTIDSRYASANDETGAGIFFEGTPGQHISVTNAASGVIEDTGGIGYGVDIQGGTVVNYGRISGGPGTAGYTNYGIGVRVGSNGGFVSNATTGIISAGGIFSGGPATVVNAGQVLGQTTANSKYGAVYLESGSITNLSTGTIAAESGSYGVKIGNGSGTVTNAGYITHGSNGGDAVTLAAGFANMVVVDPGARFNGVVDGGTAADATLELGSAAATGTLSGFGSEYINFGTLTFAPSAKWLFETGTANIPGIIDGFGQGNTIDITGFTATNTGAVGAGTTVTLTSSGHPNLLVHLGSSAGDVTISSGGGINGTELTAVCFCAGTMIGTPGGEVPVEKLKLGARVLTAHNGPRKIRWIGRGKVLSTPGKHTAATPVIVCKDALADNVPTRDLHVTKAHSLYIDDVLIPVEFLVNHRTILWDDRGQEVEIYHIELDSHDVILANGAAAETFRDDGNRWLFQNAYSGWGLPPQEPYAPVLTGGPVVDAAWRRLLDRAGPCHLPVTDDANLHLIVDGVRVDPSYHHDRVCRFRLPASPGSVIIASRSGIPAALGIARDPRSLGVAVRQVTVQLGAKFTLFDADDERLTAGFHDYEPADRLRWTDGHGELPAEGFARFGQGAELVLHLGGTTWYPDHKERAGLAAA
jgi:antigen 43